MKIPDTQWHYKFSLLQWTYGSFCGRFLKSPQFILEGNGEVLERFSAVADRFCGTSCFCLQGTAHSFRGGKADFGSDLSDAQIGVPQHIAGEDNPAAALVIANGAIHIFPELLPDGAS